MSTTAKRPSPYEAMMRKFSEAHKDKCRSVVVDVPKQERPEKNFATGSKYKGTWDVLGMSGTSAVYTFPNEVIYKGEFEDGVRHGNGEMHFPNGEIIKGKYRNGRMLERTLTFADGLEYSDTDWRYCKTPDRRFTLEYEKGVMPAGGSYMTADLPTREIPLGYYYTGEGFYDPNTKMVYKFDDLTAILRSPSDAEHKWIIENCRKATDEPIGPRPDLYDEWLEPKTKLEPPPLPACISRATTWMFESNRSLKSYYSDDSDMFMQKHIDLDGIIKVRELKVKATKKKATMLSYFTQDSDVVALSKSIVAFTGHESTAVKRKMSDTDEQKCVFIPATLPIALYGAETVVVEHELKRGNYKKTFFVYFKKSLSNKRFASFN